MASPRWGTEPWQSTRSAPTPPVRSQVRKCCGTACGRRARSVGGHAAGGLDGPTEVRRRAPPPRAGRATRQCVPDRTRLIPEGHVAHLYRTDAPSSAVAQMRGFRDRSWVLWLQRRGPHVLDSLFGAASTRGLLLGGMSSVRLVCLTVSYGHRRALLASEFCCGRRSSNRRKTYAEPK